MPSAKTLFVNSAFGPSLEKTILLAQQPDERIDSNGDPLPNVRSFVLGLRGRKAVLLEERPLPLVNSWYSASGVAYIASNERSTLQTWQSGSWAEEPFSPKPVDFIRYVFAIAGDSPHDDTVFLMARKRIYVRVAGKWRNFRAPGEGLPLQTDGTRADQVFIGGSTLSMWDGNQLVELESPEDDLMNRLAVSADDRLVGGNQYVNISNADGTWSRVDTPTLGMFAYARFRDSVYALSDKMGLLKVYPGKVEVLSSPIDPMGLASVGDGLIAYGTDGVLAYDGKQCFDVQIPACEVGKLPV
jgi:hypothetical protein